MDTSVHDFDVNYHFYMFFHNMYKYNPYNLILTFRASFWSRTRLLGFSVRPNHWVWVSWQNDCPRITKEINLPHSLRYRRRVHGDPWSIKLVAGAGLERCDLWVMSPTSYQLLHPANFFIVAVERFERPNTGFRILCLTSLAKRQ